MTISLLRQIWQRVVEKQAAPRQRLTGFEPLEPRMVLSGFSAFFAPDYSALPAGDYSHIDRAGAEYAKPENTEYGRLADYNTSVPGGSAIVDSRMVRVEGVVGLGPNFAPGTVRDLLGVSGPMHIDDVIDGGAADLVFSRSAKLALFNGVGDASFSAVLSQASFATSTPVLADHLLDSDGDAGSAALSSRFVGFLSFTAVLPPVTGSPLNQAEVRIFPGSLNGMLERRTEPRENVVEGAGGAPRAASLEAAFAHGTGVETTRATASSNTAIALLAGQTDGLRGANATRSADGSSGGGQDNGQASPTAAREQSELDEAYAMSRRGLKRKLPGDVTALDETDGEDAELVQEISDGEVVLLMEAARSFDPAGNAGTQIPELALANLPADGLIDVLAADVNSLVGDAKLLDTGRWVAVEPASVAYQAFEMVIDRNPQAEGRIADAADVATVAMNESPVVTQ